MLTAIGTASAHTPQTPHVSTGGTVLANNGSIGLNNLEFIGSKVNLRAGFVIDTYDSAVTTRMFGVGLRDKSLADTTSLEAGGLYRAATTNSGIYFRDNINAPTSVTLTTVTGTLASGVVVECISSLFRAGNFVTPDDRGAYLRGCRHSAQTAGGLVASGNNTGQMTNNTSNDMQITFTNTWNLTNVIRLIWLEAFGMEAVNISVKSVSEANLMSNSPNSSLEFLFFRPKTMILPLESTKFAHLPTAPLVKTLRKLTQPVSLFTLRL